LLAGAVVAVSYLRRAQRAARGEIAPGTADQKPDQTDADEMAAPVTAAERRAVEEELQKLGSIG
jgi:hypothetical protein